MIVCALLVMFCVGAYCGARVSSSDWAARAADDRARLISHGTEYYHVVRHGDVERAKYVYDWERAGHPSWRQD